MKEYIDDLIDAQEDELLTLAKKGDVDSIYDLAKYYYENYMFDEAYEWFNIAANAGIADALFYIGVYYENPFGFDVVENDMDTAIEYYKKAADAGSALAMYEMGIKYLQGWGIAEDKEKGIEFLMKATEYDIPKACFKLAICYEYGEGVQKDLEKALYYAKEAYTKLQEMQYR